MATISPTKEPPTTGYDHDDSSLRTGEGGLTVWTLQKMLEEKRYDELNRLFDNGLTMNSLPVGISAGAGGAAFDIGIDPIISWLALKLWRGKIFFSSNNKLLLEMKKDAALRATAFGFKIRTEYLRSSSS